MRLLVNNTNLHPILHHFQVLWIIGQSLAFDRGTSLVRGEPLNEPLNPRNEIWPRETRHIVRTVRNFDILDPVGVAYECDGQTDRTAFSKGEQR